MCRWNSDEIGISSPVPSLATLSLSTPPTATQLLQLISGRSDSLMYMLKNKLFHHYAINSRWLTFCWPITALTAVTSSGGGMSLAASSLVWTSVSQSVSASTRAAWPRRWSNATRSLRDLTRDLSSTCSFVNVSMVTVKLIGLTATLLLIHRKLLCFGFTFIRQGAIQLFASKFEIWQKKRQIWTLAKDIITFQLSLATYDPLPPPTLCISILQTCHQQIPDSKNGLLGLNCYCNEQPFIQ